MIDTQGDENNLKGDISMLQKEIIISTQVLCYLLIQMSWTLAGLLLCNILRFLPHSFLLFVYLGRKHNKDHCRMHSSKREKKKLHHNHQQSAQIVAHHEEIYSPK